MNFEICKKCIGEYPLMLWVSGCVSGCKKFLDISSINFILSDISTRCFLDIHHPVKVVISDIYSIIANKQVFFFSNEPDECNYRECLVKSGFESVIFDKIDIVDCSVFEELKICPYLLEHQLHYWSLEK